MKRVQGLMVAVCSMAMAAAYGQRVAAADKAPEERCVLFVNVAKAAPDAVFQLAAKEACRQVRAKFRVGALSGLAPSELLVSREKLAQKLGQDVAVVVYLVNDAQANGFVNVPGMCAWVNARSLKQDSPSEELYQKRVTKLLMKGLAHASGVGANIDPRCVMYWKSFSLEGIDATSASFGPHAFFVLQETLQLLGGDGLFTLDPAQK